MGDKPFLCSKCGNWYIAVPMPPNTMCRWCAEGRHAANAATGIIDCHWGQTSATPSEVQMAELLVRCERVQREIGDMATGLAKAKDWDAAKAVMERAEISFAHLQVAVGQMADILRWAGVLEMPGLRGGTSEERFKHIDAVRSMAVMHRRPPEDVEMLERSERVCQEIGADVTRLMATIPVALAEGRRAATNWQAPVTDKSRAAAGRRRTAKARIARKSKPAIAV